MKELEDKIVFIIVSDLNVFVDSSEKEIKRVNYSSKVGVEKHENVCREKHGSGKSLKTTTPARLRYYMNNVTVTM